MSVDKFVESFSAEHWRVHNVRATTRGSLKLRVLRKSVYVWDNQSNRRVAMNSWSPRTWMDKIGSIP